MSSTKMKLKKGFVLNAYKEKFTWFVKNEIFSQVNLICIKVEEQKVRVNNQQFCWRKIWDSIEFKGILGKGKNEFGIQF